MAKQKKHKIDLSAEAEGFGQNPFAALSATSLPEAPKEVVEALSKTPPTQAGWDLSHSKKLVLRCDTKRRKGRVVTLIEGIEGGEAKELKVMARELGKKLGSGATVDSETVILIQGDHRERLPALLEAHGASGVTVR